MEASMAKFVSDRNIRFMMNEVFDLNQLTRYPHFSEHNDTVFQMIVDAASKLAEKELYPLLREMDQKQPTFENSAVKVHPKVKKLMKTYGEGGWISAGFPESEGGDQLPESITAISRFIFAAANYSASVYPELSAGAAKLITTFGSKYLIDTYVPQLISGKWQGTMALTEPQAGSSLSDITTTAYPISLNSEDAPKQTNSDKLEKSVGLKKPEGAEGVVGLKGAIKSESPSSHRPDTVYKIKGQKTFISAGDHNGVENIVHLMLARIDGAPDGVKGISLFVVPKKRWNAHDTSSVPASVSIDGSGSAPESSSKTDSDDGGELQKGASPVSSCDKWISNDVKTVGIYHKLGYRGAPITELAMGDGDDCLGWLVGEPGRGLIQMFQMMNEARLGVGLGATAIASAAYHAALAYASERPQGRPLGSPPAPSSSKQKVVSTEKREDINPANEKKGKDNAKIQSGKNPSTPQIPIIRHADVKRMLLFQKAMVEGAFSLILQCCLYADLKKVTTGEEREKYGLLLDLLTPVAKSWPSEQGILSVSMAMQCFGGYGYCEDFPIEQYFRDVRIHPIHEGTTGIQGMDLLGRKLLMANGKAAGLFIGEVQKAIHNADSLSQQSDHDVYRSDLAFAVEKMSDAMALLEKTGNQLFGVAQKKGVAAFLADATLFLEFFGIAAIAWQWLVQGTVAVEALCEIDMDPAKGDNAAKIGKSEKERCFYEGKRYAMNYFFRYELPKMNALATRLTDGDDLTVTMPEAYLI